MRPSAIGYFQQHQIPLLHNQNLRRKTEKKREKITNPIPQCRAWELAGEAKFEAAEAEIAAARELTGMPGQARISGLPKRVRPTSLVLHCGLAALQQPRCLCWECVVLADSVVPTAGKGCAKERARIQRL